MTILNLKKQILAYFKSMSNLTRIICLGKFQLHRKFSRFKITSIFKFYSCCIEVFILALNFLRSNVFVGNVENTC